MSDSVLVSVIGGVCGIIVAIITVRYKVQSVNPKNSTRIDFAVDIYEGLIKNLNSEVNRRDETIKNKDEEIEKLAKEIIRLRG